MTSPPPEEYEVFALRYSTSTDRKQSNNFLRPDDHVGPVAALDYFFFALRSSNRTIVVDTGFDPPSGERKQRKLLRAPDEALRQVGIEAGDVRDVILTHAHWDHIGGLNYFPKATFHIQRAEMAFCTGPLMSHWLPRGPLDVEHVVALVRAVFAGRVRFYDGTAEIAPGITAYLVGGHSPGLQALRVATSHGDLVLAGDALHFWANWEEGNPFPIVADLEQVLTGYDFLASLVGGRAERLIPGHDPLILGRYPAVPGAVDVVRVDLPQVG